MVNIAIIGTSNSILKDGFYSGLHENKWCKLTNISLGASSSAVGVWAIEKVDFHEYDFVIMDLLNNEEHIIYSGYNTIERALGNILTLVNKCSLAGSIPVIVSFPRKFFFGDECEIRPLHRSVMALAKNLSISKFDLYELVDSVLASNQNFSLDNLFMDEAHLKRPIAKLIGSAIADLLINKFNNELIVNKKFFDVSYYSAKYISVVSNDFDAERIERKNNFTKETFSKIQDGRYLFDFGPDESYITAVHCNAAVSNGAIFINGQRATGPTPESQLNSKESFLSVIRPLPNPILVKKVCVLEIANELGLDDSPVYELAGFVLQKLGSYEKNICVASGPQLSEVGISLMIDSSFMN